MSTFFEPDLFEFRDRVLTALQTRGLLQYQHFESIDLLHQECGLEVCEIAREADARTIFNILRRLFPNWRHGCLKPVDDSATRWYVILQRNKSWQPGDPLQ